ncbi:MAG: hypothetical protein J0L83_14565 [Chitinophagales bacterium]|nr:hypothetical protein [Chitinophagales bacterium]
MNVTGSAGIATLSATNMYAAGFCQWWFALWEDVASFPDANKDQELTQAPTLKAGKSWYGPITVNRHEFGLKEQLSTAAAGLFYKIELEGYIGGSNRNHERLLQNLPYHRLVVIGQQRAGGLMKFIGGPDSWLKFNFEQDSGKIGDSAITSIKLTGQQLHKGLVITEFSGVPSIPPITPENPTGGGGSGEGSVQNGTEVIMVTNQPTHTIAWTQSRKDAFGDFPLIQVWFKNGSNWDLANVPIQTDAAAPNQTQFLIDFTGATDAMIIIK